jgi:hypothetical protein
MRGRILHQCHKTRPPELPGGVLEQYIETAIACNAVDAVPIARRSRVLVKHPV